MAKTDRQARQLRQLSVSHLNIAGSHIEQAKSAIKAGMGKLALDNIYKAQSSLDGAQSAIPLGDVADPAALSNLMGSTPGAAQEQPEKETEKV